jgi:competence protein ComEC
LLTGDIEAAGERALVDRLAGRRFDVLKAPHHGSRTSSGATLLDAVAPWLAVASAGSSNRYGFPHAEVVRRYADRGIPLLSTDRVGAVSVVMDARGVRVETAKML